jgi:hypothetical protein
MMHTCSVGKCLTDAKSACKKRLPKALCESTNANVDADLRSPVVNKAMHKNTYLNRRMQRMCNLVLVQTYVLIKLRQRWFKKIDLIMVSNFDFLIFDATQKTTYLCLDIQKMIQSTVGDRMKVYNYLMWHNN